MKKIVKFSLKLFVLLGCFVQSAHAQQDAQYTQYMYNTMSVNPGYTGSREVLSFTGLYRSQWVGLKGAPTTYTFSGHSPISEKAALGLNILKDEIFITDETQIDLSYSYTLDFERDRKLAFGLKAGAHLLNVDFSQALNNMEDGEDPILAGNIDNRFSPQFGVGLYYHTPSFYLGLSVPNILETKHFDTPSTSSIVAEVATERINYYAIAGYVMEVNHDLKFKPTLLLKWVDGAPLQVDVSANFLFNEKFTLGAAYRWSAAVSAMFGFQLTDQLMLGAAYDIETTEVQQFNSGSFEFLLRYELPNKRNRLVQPRFF